MHIRRRSPHTDRTPSRVRRAWFLAVLVIGTLAGVGLPSQPAGATHLPDLQCGVNPTTDVRLRADLTCDQGFVGDLGGHTLTVVNGTCTFFGRCGAIYNEASVRNGKIVGDLKNIRRTSFVRVAGSVYLNENTPDPALLEASTVRGGRVGILGPDATVRFSVVSGGGAVGGGIQFLDALAGITNARIYANRISDSPAAGISVLSTCGSCAGSISGAIAFNTITRSGTAGIDVKGQLPSVGRLEITGNIVRTNGGDGIHVAASPAPPTIGGGPIVITGNWALRNGGHGINSEWIVDDPTQGVVDGGHNQSRWNAVSPQCVGVDCSSHCFDFGGPSLFG